MEMGQPIFNFQRWYLYPHKRNNKEDVSGRNGVIWPCCLVEVLKNSGFQGPPSGENSWVPFDELSTIELRDWKMF